MCRNRERVLSIFFAGLLVIIASFPGKISAQGSFPSKPITMIIDQGPGGMNDVITRALCKVMEKELGQPIVCENKPGAAGAVAVNYVVKSKADGYTLGTSGLTANVTKPFTSNPPFDVRTDITDIAVYLNYTHALCVKADAPWKTIEEAIAYARQNSGKFNYSSVGVGTNPHIAMEQIAIKEGIKWSNVPFQSGSESVLACLGGHVSAATGGPADIVPQIQAGKLRLIFSLSGTRFPIAPNVPCIKEKYGWDLGGQKSIIGPAGIPDAVVEKLQNAVKKAVDDPTIDQLAKTYQIERLYMSGKDFSKYWRSRYDAMEKVIKTMGLYKKE